MFAVHELKSISSQRNQEFRLIQKIRIFFTLFNKNHNLFDAYKIFKL